MFSNMPKKTPKSVAARTQPCLTPLRSLSGSEGLTLNCTVPFESEWKDSTMLCSLGGQPIFGRNLKRPSLLTRSNTLVRSTKAVYKGMYAILCTSLVTSVDRSARKPHCDSGRYVHQLLEAYEYDPSKYFADNADYREMPLSCYSRSYRHCSRIG